MTRTSRGDGSLGLVALVLAAAVACGGDGTPPGADGGPADAGTPPPDAGDPLACAAGPEGLDCLFALWDRVRVDCAPAPVGAFVESIARRHGALPAWHGGRALFVTGGAPASIAGDMNGWQPDALVTRAVCGTAVHAAEAPLASGRYLYKLVDAGGWRLDPENFAFAYDDFAGNADGKNSVLATYDAGVGQLVRPDDEVCSDVLGNCRPYTTYLPAGYGDPANATRRYPVLFMHDGQNVFDDHDCCFGHTGWEVNVTLDDEIARGAVEPVVVVAFDHAGADRAAEYAYDRREQFIEFQVEEVEPRAFARWRLDEARAHVAGSSFGGHISLLLAMAHPERYVGAASLSGAFWPEMGTERSIFAVLGRTGKVPVALYLDHGGTADDGEDGYWGNVQMRDQLVGLGWQRADAPACAASSDTVCYEHDEGASHDELAWKARVHLMLRYFFAAPSGA